MHRSVKEETGQAARFPDLKTIEKNILGADLLGYA